MRQHGVKSTSSTSSSTSPCLQYSGGVSLYAWCHYSWVFMLLKCGAGVTTRQVWSESSHGVTRPMISKNWTDFILKWTGLYTLELTTHWPQSWLCGNTLVVMTHTKFPLSPFDQEYNLIKPDPVCITHQKSSGPKSQFQELSFTTNVYDTSLVIGKSPMPTHAAYVIKAQTPLIDHKCSLPVKSNLLVTISSQLPETSLRKFVTVSTV